MKKIASVFILAVFVPSLLLAWMAFRSVRDQQIVSERQRELLIQAATDELARSIDDTITDQQRLFGEEVEAMAAERPLMECARRFDQNLQFDSAAIGFVVTVDGQLLAPIRSPGSDAGVAQFLR